MRHCDRCQVDIAGSCRLCPLCQGPLAGAPDETEDRFPPVEDAPFPHLMLVRVLGFFSVAAVVICFAVNWVLPSGGWWALFVAAALASVWASFFVAVRKRRNLQKNILWQVVTISAIALLWDLWTGWHRWSVDYVLPILCICAMVGMTVSTRVLHLRITDHMVYLLLGMLFGLIPLLLMVCGVVRSPVPSVVCVAGSIIFLAALLVFRGADLWAEVVRRMHL